MVVVSVAEDHEAEFCERDPDRNRQHECGQGEGRKTRNRRPKDGRHPVPQPRIMLSSISAHGLDTCGEDQGTNRNSASRSGDCRGRKPSVPDWMSACKTQRPHFPSQPDGGSCRRGM